MTISIFGAAGTIGQAVFSALRERGQRVRVVGRSEAKLRAAFPEGAELVAADVSTAAGCARAAQGAEAIVYALGLPYAAKEFAAYKPMMEQAIAAARAASVARLLLITNVYPYGLPRAPRVAETHPREPCSVKGMHRKDQEDVVLAADDPRGLRTVTLRLPDFYGPHAELSLAQAIFDAAAKGETAMVPGAVDQPHEFVFTPDVGPVVADLLAARDEAYGSAYNLAGAGVIKLEEFAAKVYAAFGRPTKLRAVGPLMLRVAGMFSAAAREQVEMLYLQTHPILLDDSKLRALLPVVRRTSYDEGIRLTLEHMQRRRSAAPA